MNWLTKFWEAVRGPTHRKLQDLPNDTKTDWSKADGPAVRGGRHRSGEWPVPMDTPPKKPEKDPRIVAFALLFPDAKGPSVKPVDGHQVYVLDIERSHNFVHIATYCKDGDHYESDGGWFEANEVCAWAYAPNIKQETERIRDKSTKRYAKAQ